MCTAQADNATNPGDSRMIINDTMTVAEIAAEFPASLRVFQRHGIDFCCGGKQPLRAVCDEQGVSFEELQRALEGATAAVVADERNWTRAQLHELIDHIVSTYHTALRQDLPRLAAMATKAAGVHGAKSGNLSRIVDCLGELAADLNAHMVKEETVLFPAIRAIETGALTTPAVLSGPISVMEHEHDDAARLLAELRRLTDDYVVPEWGCATVRGLYRGLADLESSMHMHVHLENNVLFPRALRTAVAVR